MPKRKKVFTVLWVIIAILTIVSIASLILFPQWKGIFYAGGGGFLILNLLLSMFFIKRNYK
jgi:uncharacterized membrane protein